MVAPFFTFFILTIDNASTFDTSSFDSSSKRALAKVSCMWAILASCRPCASLAASYSAFSDRSPLSLASAMAFDILARPVVFKYCNSSFNFSNPSFVKYATSAITHVLINIQKKPPSLFLRGRHHFKNKQDHTGHA